MLFEVFYRKFVLLAVVFWTFVLFGVVLWTFVLKILYESKRGILLSLLFLDNPSFEVRKKDYSLLRMKKDIFSKMKRSSELKTRILKFTIIYYYHFILHFILMFRSTSVQQNLFLKTKNNKK